MQKDVEISYVVLCVLIFLSQLYSNCMLLSYFTFISNVMLTSAKTFKFVYSELLLVGKVSMWSLDNLTLTLSKIVLVQNAASSG